MSIGFFARVTRAAFLPASVLPYLLGAAYASYMGFEISPGILAAGLLGVTCAHLGGNLLNDYFDHKSGADEAHPRPSVFFGGSRAIQEGTVSPEYILLLASCLLFLASVCGAFLAVYTRSPAIAAFMSAGGFAAVAYTAPPFKLAYRKMGEAGIFFAFGVLLVLGGYRLFASSISLGTVMVSLPVSFLIVSVILCNEIPDRPFDMKAGKNNLISLCGADKGYLVYAGSVAMSALSLAAVAASGLLPIYCLFAVPVYLLGVNAALLLKDRYDAWESTVRASGMTAAMHAGVGVMLLAVMLAGNVRG